MDQVKLQVQRADGQYRGGLFTDYGQGTRWDGTPSPGLIETMVCVDGDASTGSWYLMQYVVPRDIVGEAERDSLFDQKSTACVRTPVQALRWFAKQDFGPPQGLVTRVREFHRDWRVFCRSAPAHALLASLIGKFIADDAPLLADASNRDNLGLLERLDLLSVSDGSRGRSYSARGIVTTAGVAGFIGWMNHHLIHVAEFVTEAAAPNYDPRQDEIEAGRLVLQAQAISEAQHDVERQVILWQVLTDVIFRTNVPDESRIQDLLHLRQLVVRLAQAALDRCMPRQALHALDARLRSLTPREWFRDRLTREAVTQAVGAANAEVMELQHQLVTGSQAGAEQVTRPEPAVIGKPGRTLQGWIEILPAVGLDATSRTHKDMVKRMNRESQGPIVVVGGKSVIADEAKLLSWWSNRIKQAEAACDRQPDQSRVGASEMESPGARIEQGFHLKSPRRRRARS